MTATIDQARIARDEAREIVLRSLRRLFDDPRTSDHERRKIIATLRVYRFYKEAKEWESDLH